MKYELVIFDCDGTLVDSESLTNRIIADMLTEIGIPTTAKASYDLFAGKKFSDIVLHINQQSIDYKADFETEFRRRSKIVFEQELKPIPGIMDLLRNIKIPMCIASNGPRVKMAVSLKATEIKPFFPDENIFSAYDLQKWKPKPDLFLHAAKKMNTIPSKCIVIEDTISGVMGAINANMDVLAYNPHQDITMKNTSAKNFTTIASLMDYILPLQLNYT
jgi:HAD superfamily hydrolase (TIGR01509 family)